MKYLIQNNDDTVSIVHLIRDKKTGTFKESIDDIVNNWVPEKRNKIKNILPLNDEDIPLKRNYRNSWQYDEDSKKISIDIEKAIGCQVGIIIQKAHERCPKDSFGQTDFSQVEAELNDIDFKSIDNLDDLYNTFPKSIDKRLDKNGKVKRREYRMYQE